MGISNSHQTRTLVAMRCHVDIRGSNTTTHLLQLTRHREGLGPVEYPDVVEAQEAATKQISAVRILSINPPKQTHYVTILP